MKKFLLFIILSFAFTNAQFFYDKYGESRGAYKDSMEYAKLVELAQRFRGPILVKKPVEGVKPRKNLKKIPQGKIQRTFEVRRDSLRDELWLEVEKNEIVKICVDGPVVAWETSLESAIINDSCLVFQAPTLIGVNPLNVYFSDADSSHRINFAVGMKYLDFKSEEVLLGYNIYDKSLAYSEDKSFAIYIYSEFDVELDPERLALVSGTYLIDKYPITNCEFTQVMWDSIPDKTTYSQQHYRSVQEEWISRKKHSKRNEKCITHDTAATRVFLYQSMKYANARSIREGLKPYYIFVETDDEESIIIADKNSKAVGYIIGYYDFVEHENKLIWVKIDNTSDGYRLLFYDEWMMFARGGDKKNKAPWGDSSATFKEASKHATFKSLNRDFFHSVKEMHLSEPVGQRQPNGYGLYDVFGLNEEQVLLKKSHPLFTSLGVYYFNNNFPYCLKGGTYYVTESRSIDNGNMPYWKYFNYGRFEYGYPGIAAGFRLIRNIGNNATWEKVEAKTK